MGRPKKSIKRQEKLTVKFTKAEMKFLESLANKHGQRKAPFVRAKALGHETRLRLTEDEHRYYRHLTGMANNLNQLARAANSQEILTLEILKTLEAINVTIEKLK